MLTRVCLFSGAYPGGIKGFIPPKNCHALHLKDTFSYRYHRLWQAKNYTLKFIPRKLKYWVHHCCLFVSRTTPKVMVVCSWSLGIVEEELIKLWTRSGACSFTLYFYHLLVITWFYSYVLILYLSTIYGTEWPIMCWCAVKKLLTHTYMYFMYDSLNNNKWSK